MLVGVTFEWKIIGRSVILILGVYRDMLFGNNFFKDNLEFKFRFFLVIFIKVIIKFLILLFVIVINF